MNFTKMQVLPDPDSDALRKCDDNSAMRVLAVAIYCQLERHYFDETHSHIDVATLFHCSSSQLAKAITGVDLNRVPITTNQRNARVKLIALKWTLQKQKHPAKKILSNWTQKNQLYQKRTHYPALAVAVFFRLAYSKGFQNYSLFLFVNSYVNARFYYLSIITLRLFLYNLSMFVYLTVYRFILYNMIVFFLSALTTLYPSSRA